MEEEARSPRELNRQARRHAGRRARGKMILAATGAVVVVAAAVALQSLVLVARDDPRPSGVTPGEEGRAVLFVVTDSSGQGASIGLAGSNPDFASVFVLFPPALQTTLPGFGEGELTNAARFGGADLAEATVMNLLGARVDTTSVVEASVLAAAIGRPLIVDLPNPLVIQRGNSQVVAVAEGEDARSPEELAMLLTTPGVGDQLAWLVRQGAVWSALLSEIAQDPSLAEALASTSPEGEVLRAGLVEVAGDDERQIVAAPVTRVERAGGTVELYDLNGTEAADFTASQFPYLQLAAEPRVRVEILNGNGLIGTTQLVADLMIRNGLRVVRTDNADSFDYATTRVIAQGRNHQQNALDVQRLLSLGEVEVEQRQPSGVVDLTIIVGGDLPSGSSQS